MYSLKDKFDEVCLRLGQGRRLENLGSDPIYYLVFPVSDIIEVKRQTRAWVAKLENQGWHVVVFSMANAVNVVLCEHRLRKQWLVGEKMLLDQAERSGKPIEFGEINKTLAKALTEGPELFDLAKSKMEEASTKPGGLLLITDLEALHPYLRINSIESRLRDMIRCPVLVLYPGKREGKTSLRFLEFYPPDPNYRSEHIG
jgi:Domain of unknown function (DUF1788)